MTSYINAPYGKCAIEKNKKKYFTEDLAYLIFIHFYSMYENILTQIKRHVYKGMSCYMYMGNCFAKTSDRKQFMEFLKDQPHFYTFCSLFIINIRQLICKFRLIYSCPSLLWIGITMLGCVFKALIPPIVFINCRQHW